jgi:HD-GYP domain-containing protein (c-di-GMP phosphodiesterase class II)
VERARARELILRDTFGVPFALYDAATGERVCEPDAPDSHAVPAELVARAAEEMVGDGRPRVEPAGAGHYQVMLVLYAAGQPEFVAVGLVAALCPSAAPESAEHCRLRGWVEAVSDRLRLADQLAARQLEEGALNSRAAEAWKVNFALADTIRRVRVHKDEEKSRQRVLATAFGLLDVRALVWVPARPDGEVLAQGDAPLPPDDCRWLADALGKSPEFRPGEPMLCNEPRSCAWGAAFPQVANLLAFPVMDRAVAGWVLAFEKGARRGQGTAPFRRSDAAVLSPFVSLLELHARSVGRFHDLKEVLIGLARSLTAAIDAKDAYTAGHSERVARIAVEVGRELEMDDEQLSDVYLAGLLHDVGKIGVRDEVLCKTGPLTPDEYEHVKQHVTIGRKILAEVRPIAGLLPGVVYHHERYDGKGYPDGLAGENIPLLARLLAVADAYDAMSTLRPYREPYPPGQVEEILQKGAGSQWDAHIVAALFRCKERVQSICQRGVGESLRRAIDTVLRTGDSSRFWDEIFSAGPVESSEA